jgi:hypothetical protein
VENILKKPIIVEKTLEKTAFSGKKSIIPLFQNLNLVIKL